MFRAILTFIAGITLILLILSVISVTWESRSPSEAPQKNTRSLHSDSESAEDIVVMSEQDLQNGTNNTRDSDATSTNQTSSPASDQQTTPSESDKEELIAREIEVLLESEPKLSTIVETNASLLGKISDSPAFLHHQALLRKSNQTEHIQPISIVCTNTLCNILVHGADADVAEDFAESLVAGETKNIVVAGGEYRIFNDSGYDFAHIVLYITKQQ